MPKRSKRWSKQIEEAGVRMRLYQRADASTLWYAMIGDDGRRIRRRLKTTDKELAENRARDIAREIARTRLTGVTPDTLPLGRLFAAYERHKLPTLSDDWAKTAKTRLGLFLEAWGGDQVAVDLGQTQVDTYCRARRSGRLSPLGKGEGRGDRAAIKVRDGTLDNDLRFLSSVFNWARKHKENGKRLLTENPLHDVSWPREANPLRPVASHARYVATQAHTDAVDESGRLRAILALARYAGRREGAICELKASDVLRTENQVRDAVAGAGMDERLADHMPHGAVRWAAASDKMGLSFISPLSAPAREELDRYLRRSPRVGDVPLFPSDEDEAKPIRRDVAARWLVKAEKAAELPKLRGGTFHPYRRLWATERKHLPDVDVAAAGGWKDTRALKLSYQQADPASVLRVVEFGISSETG